MTKPRKGQALDMMSREEFRLRFRHNYFGPSYDGLRDAIAQIEEVAWDNYINEKKSPLTEKAGEGFAAPEFELSVEWLVLCFCLFVVVVCFFVPSTRSRILLICCLDRNDGTCPGEMSKTWRLTQIAREALAPFDIDTDVLDLSRMISDYDRHIHPCKGCVATAMPLCHWPCSCYPNHALHQVNDWMGEIYEKWVAAHGIIILTPVYWYQSPSALKLMIVRLVCADGGNPDPTSTAGKDPEKAKALELQGWTYPKHLAGRAYGLAVHGDVAGIEGSRRALSDWLDWMGLIDAGVQSRLDRYIGYYESYALSHEVLDRDEAIQEEVRNVARAVAEAVKELRENRLSMPDAKLQRPRPK